LAFSALLIAAPGAVDLLLKAVSDSTSQTLSVITVGIISGALLSVLGALVVGRLGLWRQTGLIGGPARPVSLLWFLPFVVYGLLPLTQAPT